MAHYTYLALTRAVPGREAEFDSWYDNQHLQDVARMPGIVSARRLHVDWQKSNDFDAPEWRSLAIYEIEADDPQLTIAAIRAASGTELMPFSDAMTKTGMVQLLVRPVEPIDETS